MNKLKQIRGWPEYSITLGEEVYNEKSTKWLKTRVDKSTGYKMVNLQHDGLTRPVAIHRLLLETFVGPCPEGMQCRHLDGNKLNNDLENLCWGTPYENDQDMVKHGVVWPGNRKLTTEDVTEIRHLWSSGLASIRMLSKRFCVSYHVIWRVVKRKAYLGTIADPV